MLPLIGLGLAVVTTGLYLMNEAKSSNKKARRNYYNVCNKADKRIKHAAYHASKKDNLDKLFNVKHAKVKVSDAIYVDLKNERKNLKSINTNLRESKDILSKLFTEKKIINSREEKRSIQETINIIVESRKKIFPIKDSILVLTKELDAKLKKTNADTRAVQEQINKVLDK